MFMLLFICVKHFRLLCALHYSFHVSVNESSGSVHYTERKRMQNKTFCLFSDKCMIFGDILFCIDTDGA